MPDDSMLPPWKPSNKKPAGKQAARPETLESDQEITITFQLKTHGSTNTANALIEYIKRQLSTILHTNVEMIGYDVRLPPFTDEEIQEAH